MEGGGGETRQWSRFLFAKLTRDWRALDPARRSAAAVEFEALVRDFQRELAVRTYTTVGTRGDADFCLWMAGPNLDVFRRLITALYSTALGPYLETPYSLLAMTRRSQYVEQHRHPGQEGARAEVQPSGAAYVFVYPFAKSKAWYKLGKQARQGMMNEHIQIGHKYPSVKINTTYAYGIDDQEFVLAFETDEPSDFLDLVMELRGSEASQYTTLDTPSFTCQRASPREVIEALGGLGARQTEPPKAGAPAP
ncbi:MAG: chlorite dismutase family protein [Actinobacteria bacterium]|nr:chlorite dismutase family protein [Actinomycetota bacterium]